MMAGTGVSAGGAGMLRARRRDVSVKPNRKLDRKSSRGMIYENEELRLRTIHINAEVEQGQNDIKKLRRENEQLRREIWSLRDEYDKLEDILKSQKNREGSEDYEDRSEGEDKDDDEEAEERSVYSVDEDDEAEERDAKSADDDMKSEIQASQDDQEERLENAENQKISTEKMNNSLHRLHVEFDDLSVVDEEEELRKEKDRREPITTEEKDGAKSSKDPAGIRMDRGGYQCFPPSYGSPGVFASGHPYYPECPFAFPDPNEAGCAEVLPLDPTLLTPCSMVYDAEHGHLCGSHLTCGTSVGWQSAIFPPGAVFPGPESYQSSVVPGQAPGMGLPALYADPNESDRSATASTLRATSIPRGTSNDERGPSARLMGFGETDPTNLPSLSQRRNVLLKQPMSFFRDTVIPSRGVDMANSADALTRNGWDFGKSASAEGDDCGMFRETENRENASAEKAEKVAGPFDDSAGSGTSHAAGTDRPKHFFAPLPAMIQHSRRDSNDKTAVQRAGTGNPNDSPSAMYFDGYGTGLSSSSDRTNSTVISARHLQRAIATGANGHFSDGHAKGSADICVNGAIPAVPSDLQDFTSNDPRCYRSTENLLIEMNRDDSRGNSSSRQGSNTPLLKSLSCQDLTSEQLQSSLYDIGRSFNCDRSQKFAKSDNTLDNPVADPSKAFRSQLNVTLKLPGRPDHRRDSPETPEIPKLPSIDYRLFGNPFLKAFEVGGSCANYGAQSPSTGPPSVQANDNAPGKSSQRTAIDYSSPLLTHAFARRLNNDERAPRSTRATKTTATMLGNEAESDRRRAPLGSAGQPMDARIVSSPKLRQDFKVTSFEQPNPRCLHPSLGAFDINSIRRIGPSVEGSNAILTANNRKLYQNVPFVPGTAAIFCPSGQNAMRMFYENHALKVPAQTQTSIDGGSNNEDDVGDETPKNPKANGEDPNDPGSPSSARRKRNARKERSERTTEKRPLSPAAQRRRLRKQTSVDGVEGHKVGGGKLKKFGAVATAAATSEHLEDKNESRSSSSGQESPRKDRRVSLHFNGKKRPSLASVKTTRSPSIDNTKDAFGARGGGPEAMDTTNSERERTNSASSREAMSGKARKSSVSSGKVPWCACWGNGCI